ncbi:glutathione S-transferase family protein [Acuticoccus yangtzensis]|uniref:glutathione S-transferase family protein n=1 Tax=Acuticoccus yangtzensis TaxID=1443441 RepID=UPI0009498D44|nr:glutathione S-transferase family protein [Acuticoccus yangtzensis]
MKLYSKTLSPFGRTVSIVALELGLAEDIEEIDTTVKPTAPNTAFQALTPMRKIPALATDDGLVLTDSPVIVDYLCARVGDKRVLGRGTPAEWKIRADYALTRAATECAVAGRYETAVRPADKVWDAWVDDLADKVRAVLAVLEAAPPDHGGALTVADISLGVLLEYLDGRYGGLWRADHPNLVAWLAPLSAHPSFVATKPTF